MRTHRFWAIALAQYALPGVDASEAALCLIIVEDAENAAYQIAQIDACHGHAHRASEWLGRAYNQWVPGLVNTVSDPLLGRSGVILAGSHLVREVGRTDLSVWVSGSLRHVVSDRRPLQLPAMASDWSIRGMVTSRQSSNDCGHFAKRNFATPIFRVEASNALKLKIVLTLTAPILIAVVFWANGWPQQTVSSSLGACQNEQQQTVGPKQTMGENKNPAHPPPIIVNVLPPQETETQKYQKRQERDEKASLEQRSIESIVVAAFFTGVLGLSIILLWLDTRKRSNTAASAATAGGKAADPTARPESDYDP